MAWESMLLLLEVDTTQEWHELTSGWSRRGGPRGSPRALGA